MILWSTSIKHLWPLPARGIYVKCIVSDSGSIWSVGLHTLFSFSVFFHCQVCHDWCIYNPTGLIMDSLNTNDQNQYSRTRDITFLIQASLFLFKTWQLHYPQCNIATEWQRCRQFVRLHAAFSGASKDLIHAVVPQNTCKHTGVWTVGGGTL